MAGEILFHSVYFLITRLIVSVAERKLLRFMRSLLSVVDPILLKERKECRVWGPVWAALQWNLHCYSQTPPNDSLTLKLENLCTRRQKQGFKSWLCVGVKAQEAENKGRRGVQQGKSVKHWDGAVCGFIVYTGTGGQSAGGSALYVELLLPRVCTLHASFLPPSCSLWGEPHNSESCYLCSSGSQYAGLNVERWVQIKKVEIGGDYGLRVIRTQNVGLNYCEMFDCAVKPESVSKIFLGSGDRASN